MTDEPWVVIPCYNEALRLDTGAFEAQLAAERGPRFLFVNDGSTDATERVLEALAAANPERCRVVSLPQNRGKAEAVRAGMRLALDEGAYAVAYWDADLATPLEHVTEFAELLAVVPHTEIVMGSRVRMLGRHIDRAGMRHLIGRAYATLASLVLGLPVYDTQCGAKLFRGSNALVTALEQPFGSRWSFDVELLRRLQQSWGDRGIDRIIEVPLTHWRNVGNSKVSITGGAAAFIYLASLLFRGGRSLPLRAHGQPSLEPGDTRSAQPEDAQSAEPEDTPSVEPMDRYQSR